MTQADVSREVAIKLEKHNGNIVDALSELSSGDDSSEEDNNDSNAAQNRVSDDEQSIDIVMTQANVSREVAVQELRNQNGDIVNTILKLVT
jgi:nascent polypeptide-associated complex subunit alpha